MIKNFLSIFTPLPRIGSYFLFYLLYTISLDISLWFVAQVFGYEGYVYLFDFWKTLFVYSLTAGLIYLNRRFCPDKISGLFCIGIFSLFILPALVYFMRSDIAYANGILVVLGYVWLLFACNFGNRIPLEISFPGSPYFFWGIIASVSLSTYVLLFYHSGFKFNLDFSLIYEIRSQFSQHKNPLLGYLVTWQGNIINPVLFYWVLGKKRIFLAILILFFQAYLFASTGEKIFVFSTFFAYLLARFRNHLNTAIPVTLMTGAAISCLLYCYQDNVWVISLFVRRTLFTPGQLTFEYFDFFSQSPFVYLSDSVLRRFLSYPYPLPPPLLIGIRYSDGGSANVGIIGNAYMHFGVMGILLFIALLSIILVLFNKIPSSQSENAPILYALVATPLISIINSGLFTVFLTHGLFLSFLLALFMEKGNALANTPRGVLAINPIDQKD